jgi:hypothetical protein
VDGAVRRDNRKIERIWRGIDDYGKAIAKMEGQRVVTKNGGAGKGFDRGRGWWIIAGEREEDQSRKHSAVERFATLEKRKMDAQMELQSKACAK